MFYFSEGFYYSLSLSVNSILWQSLCLKMCHICPACICRFNKTEGVTAIWLSPLILMWLHDPEESRISWIYTRVFCVNTLFAFVIMGVDFDRIFPFTLPWLLPEQTAPAYCMLLSQMMEFCSAGGRAELTELRVWHTSNLFFFFFPCLICLFSAGIEKHNWHNSL